MEEVRARVISDNEPAAQQAPSVRVDTRINGYTIRRTGKKRIWDNFQIVGETQTSERTKIVVSAAIRDGIRFVQLREFAQGVKNDDWIPSKRGITIPLEFPLLDDSRHIKELLQPYIEVAELMLCAAEATEDMELYDDDNAVYVEGDRKVRKDV